MKPGLSGTQTAPAATAIIATAASGPFGNTTATRSLRPTPRLRNPRTASVRPGPERTVCHRGAPGRQDGIAVGRHSPIAGKKIFEAQKGAASGRFACRFIFRFLGNVRQAPSPINKTLVDQFVGSYEHDLRQLKPKRFGCLAVDDEFKCRRPLDRYIGGLCSAQNVVH